MEGIQVTSDLDAAVLSIMEEVSNIKKNKTVGTGQNAYQAVADIDVKVAIQRALIKHKVVIYPISVDDVTEYNARELQVAANTFQLKEKVFTKVKTKYLVRHVPTGQSQVTEGFGHGMDAQDKSAGKAMTYALKTMLLYLFMVPVGDIDDADDEQPEEKQPVQKKAAEPKAPVEPKKPAEEPKKETPPAPTETAPPPMAKKTLSEKAIAAALERVAEGEPGLIPQLVELYDIPEETLARLRAAIPKLEKK